MLAQTEEVDKKGCKSEGISQVDGGQCFENRMCHRYLERVRLSNRFALAIRILPLAKHMVNRLLYVRGCRMVVAKLNDICSLSLSKSDLLGGCKVVVDDDDDKFPQSLTNITSPFAQLISLTLNYGQYFDSE